MQAAPFAAQMFGNAGIEHMRKYGKSENTVLIFLLVVKNRAGRLDQRERKEENNEFQRPVILQRLQR